MALEWSGACLVSTSENFTWGSTGLWAGQASDGAVRWTHSTAVLDVLVLAGAPPGEAALLFVVTPHLST